jgi:hypothetical protein
VFETSAGRVMIPGKHAAKNAGSRKSLRSLYLMQASFPIVSLALANLPYSPDKMSLLLRALGLIVSATIALWPSGVLLEGAQNAGLNRKQNPAIIVSLHTPLVAGTLGLFVVLFLTIGNSMSLLPIPYLFISIVYTLGAVLSFAQCRKSHVASQIALRVQECIGRERKWVEGWLSGLPHDVWTVFRDNLMPIAALASGFTLLFISRNLFQTELYNLTGIFGLIFVSSGLTGLLPYLLSLIRSWEPFSKLKKPVRLTAYFWVLYFASVTISSVAFLCVINSNNPRIYGDLLIGSSLIAAILYVQTACFTGAILNIVLCPYVAIAFEYISTYLLKFWTWTQLSREHVLRTIETRTPVGTIQMFAHTLVELVLATFWMIVAIPVPLTASQSLLQPLVMLGALSIIPYVLLDSEYRGTNVGGLKLSPKLLHKAWSALTIIAILKQIIIPSNTTQIIQAILVFFSLSLGFTLGFLSSYEMLDR